MDLKLQGKSLYRATGAASSGTPVTVVSGTPTSGYAYLTDIWASSDKSGAILLVKDGDAIIFQQIIGTTPFNHTFEIPLRGTALTTLKAVIDGLHDCRVNIAGYIA